MGDADKVKIRFLGNTMPEYSCKTFSLNKGGVVEVSIKKATQLFTDFPFDWKKYDPADDPKPEQDDPLTKSPGGSPATATETSPVEKMSLRYQGTTTIDVGGTQVVMGQVVEFPKADAEILLKEDPLNWAKVRAPRR